MSAGNSQPVPGSSENRFVIRASGHFHYTKPVTLKELLEHVQIQPMTEFNITQMLSTTLSSTELSVTQDVVEAPNIQGIMEPADQEGLQTLQRHEEDTLNTIDITVPDKFKTEIGKGLFKHSFIKSNDDVLVVRNHLGKDILKVHGCSDIANRSKGPVTYSKLLVEIRQLILAMAARNEEPRTIMIREVRLSKTYSCFIVLTKG